MSTEPIFLGGDGPPMGAFNLGPPGRAPASSPQGPGGLKELKGPNDDFDDDADETLAERLWGLTEMFPESVRNFSWKASTQTVSLVSTLYGHSRTVMWVLASSAVIGLLPVVFETELAQLAEQQKQQQRQIMLGPGSAGAGQPPMQGLMQMPQPPPVTK